MEEKYIEQVNQAKASNDLKKLKELKKEIEDLYDDVCEKVEKALDQGCTPIVLQNQRDFLYKVLQLLN